MDQINKLSISEELGDNFAGGELYLANDVSTMAKMNFLTFGVVRK